MGNASQFRKDIEKAYDQKVIQRFVEFQKRITLEAAQEAQRLSPVWSGEFRHGHNVSVGTPDYTLPPENGDARATRWPDTPDYILPAQPMASYSGQLAGLRPFEKTYVANGVPYSRKIEFGGHSMQAPEGVYRPTAMKIRSKYAGRKLTVS